jgi:Flp pilus assembly protein TadD
MSRPLLALLATLGISALGAEAVRACELACDVQAAVDARDFAQAERLARAAVSVRPDEPQPHLDLAHVYGLWARHLDETSAPAPGLDAARSAQGLEICDAVATRWPELRQGRVCALELQLVRREDDAFIARLEQTLAAFPAPDPELMEPLEPLLLTALEQKRDRVAARTCALLVERADLTVPSLSNCGAVATRREDFARARALFERAIALEPEDDIVLRNLAMIELVDGDLLDAERHLERVAELLPDDRGVFLELAIVRTARQPERGGEIWEAVYRRCADQPAIAPSGLETYAENAVAASDEHGALGAAYLMEMAQPLLKNHPLLSAQLLGAGERLAPDDPAFPYKRAQALEGARFPRQAFAALRRAAALPPPKSSALNIPPGGVDYEAGRVALNVDRHMDAIHYLERARRARPELRNVEFLLGRAYVEAGNLAAAQREYTLCLTREHNTDEYQTWCRKNRAALAPPPASPQRASESMVTALAKARASVATPAGRAYEKTVGAEVTPRLQWAVRACVSELAAGGRTRPRALLVRVAADGTIQELMQHERLDAEPQCFARHLRGLKVAAPPEPDWWLEFTIDFKS